MNPKKELLIGLAAEQIDKIHDCDNIDDLLQLVKDEGVELTDEQLSAVSGGGCDTTDENNGNGSRRKREA